MMSQYNKLIPDYAIIVKALDAHHHNNARFQWTDDEEKCFVSIKQLFVNSIALGLFDPTLSYIILTNALDYWLDAVFMKIHPNDSECTVVFALQPLSPTERKYATVEKEDMTCVWTVKRWQTYLWGHMFTLLMDYQALTTLLSTK